jgi:TolA-binding protein
MNMKHTFLTCASLGALLLGAACSKSDSSTVRAEGTAATSQSGNGPSVEVDYSYSQKSELVAKMKEQLANVNQEIEKLSSKVANSTDSASKDAKARLEELKDKSKNLNVEIGRTESATESTWNDVKASSKKAYNDVKDSFRDAREWASEKIAPK